MKTPLLLLALLGATLASAQTPATPAATPPAVVEAPFTVTRKASNALLSWNISTDDVFVIELYRNTQADTKGRTRVGSVSGTRTSFTDPAADAATTYWYWLKVIRLDRTHFNIGPVKSSPVDPKAP